MLMNSVFVAGTLILNLAGAGPPTGTDPAASSRSTATAAAIDLAVTDSFAPPTRRKPARKAGPRRAPAGAPDSAEADEEEAPPPARRSSPTTRQRPAVEEDEATASSDEEDDEEETPRLKSKRRRPAEEEEDEEEDEEDAPLASMPSVIPRLISVGIGGTAIGRNFAFNAATQQKESTFPRLGVTLTAEAYPLLRFQRGWLRRLGAAFVIHQEIGAAALLDKPTNLSFSYPVSQRRWSFDVRYAILAGQRVAIVPAVGIGSNNFHRDARTTVNPSQCTSSYMMATPAVPAPCLADVQSMYLVAGAHLRIALTEGVSLTLGGAYLRGLTIGRGMGQIGAERVPAMAGYQAELGGNIMISSWLGVRAAIPITHYGYTFSGGMAATYASASETYYGLTVSALLFTH